MKRTRQTCTATAGGCTHKDICFGARPAGLTCTGMPYKEHIPLHPYTHLKTGGPARYFFTAQSAEDIKEAISYAKDNDLPHFILGGGSNVLVSDAPFPGVAIKNEITGITYEEGEGTVDVIAGAGEDWDALVAEVVAKELYGIENLSLIPGTVGAAPVQNIGAYGAEIKQTIKWVEVFDTRTHTIEKLTNKECQFAYRNSVFKKQNNPFTQHHFDRGQSGAGFVVTRVCMQLHKHAPLNTTYPDVEHFFTQQHITHPTLADVRNAVVAIRTHKLPPSGVGTAGSFFQNPIVANEQKDKLLETYPNLKWFPFSDTHVKVSAAWLIEHLSVGKGARIGNVGTHDEQALVLVNFGQQNAQEMHDFAERIRQDISRNTGIILPLEVNLIGVFS